MDWKNHVLLFIAGGILYLCSAPCVLAEDIIINEWCVNKGSKWIELYNTTNREVNVANYVLTDKKNEESNALEEILGTDHGITTIPPKGYVLINTKLNLGLGGDRIQLFSSKPDFEEKSNREDVVFYGYYGGAPKHPKDSSTCRIPDGLDTNSQSNDWAISSIPTPGAPNEGARRPKLGSSLVVNEVDTLNNQIELYNPTSSPVDTAGWLLCDTDGWQEIMPGITTFNQEPIRNTVIPPRGFLALDSTMKLGRYDVIYLITPDKVRVDQLGWYEGKDKPNEKVSSFQRVPDGKGPNNGYRFKKSGGNNGTLVIAPGTMGSSNMQKIL